MPNLEPGETVLKTGPVVWVGGPAPPRSGTLSVTNRSLIFEGPVPPRPPMGPGRGGRFGMRPGFGPRGPPPMQEGELHIPLWRCQNASAVTDPRGTFVEVDLLSRRIFFQTADAAGWAAVITQARMSAPPAPPGGPAGRGGPVGMGRAQMPKCPYCGQLSQATATKCESCGAPFKT
jgi:hypothetical protein